MMDQEDRLALIALLATDDSWKTLVKVGEVIIRDYPASVFSGVSGDPGPVYIAALRKAFLEVKRRERTRPHEG